MVRFAALYGHDPETIWNAPENAALKSQRAHMNELLPGDVVTIPDIIPKQVRVATGVRHVFRRKNIPPTYRLRVLVADKPRANEPFRLTVGDRVVEGTTDADGMIHVHVPAAATKGELVLGTDGLTVLIDFGFLDPIMELSGVQMRLNNLGFPCGEAGGVLNDETRQALQAFQARFGLSATGELDDATRGKLQELHDSGAAFPPPPAESGSS
ncbi:MAG TPA: peptidoglycan-binding domain-containing protein [Thermoanaerobaculia bacterium]|nr:peptidoglycan-binding domain-containing protein [Thermoanaerobaculia bacterium]